MQAGADLSRIPAELADAARRKAQLAQEFVQLLEKPASLETILLVGSASRGYADADSDIDLIAVDPEVDSLVKRVEEHVIGTERLKVETYSPDELRASYTGTGPSFIRQALRLADARCLWSVQGDPHAILPSQAALRAALGDLNSLILPVEQSLSGARHAFELGDVTEVAIRVAMATETLAFLLLTAGHPAVCYSKPKWVWLGLSASFGGEIAFKFGEAIGANEKSAADLRANAAELVSLTEALVPLEARKSSQILRRLLWLMKKHARDSASASLSMGSAAAQSAATAAVGFSLQATASANGWHYRDLADYLRIAPRLPYRLLDAARFMLIGNEPPTITSVASRYNAAVALYEFTLARCEIEPPPDAGS